MTAVEILCIMDEEESGEINLDDLPHLFNELDLEIDEHLFEALSIWLIRESFYNTRKVVY
jgi:hypothetical protein